jgi:hypothetical protein
MGIGMWSECAELTESARTGSGEPGVDIMECRFEALEFLDRMLPFPVKIASVSARCWSAWTGVGVGEGASATRESLV